MSTDGRSPSRASTSHQGSNITLWACSYSSADSRHRAALPGGRYVVLYDGRGTISYGFDATLVSRSPGRDVINVVPSKAGIDLRITVTDPKRTGDYIRNVRLLSADNEAAIKAGQVFNPEILAAHSEFSRVALHGLAPDEWERCAPGMSATIPTYAFFAPKGSADRNRGCSWPTLSMRMRG